MTPEEAQQWGAPSLSRLLAETPTPRRLELRRAGDALRALIEQLIATTADVDDIAALADGVEALTAGMAKHRKRHGESFAESAVSGDVHAFFDDSPQLGRANPIAPPLELWMEGEGVDAAVVGTATFGSAYEGPPGCVHGGAIAAAFDEVLGMAQSIGGSPGMTGWLKVTYRSPTPLHAPLSWRGRVESVEGRKIRCLGTLHAGDRLCAEAEGLFISVDFTKMRALAEAAEERRPSS